MRDVILLVGVGYLLWKYGLIKVPILPEPEPSPPPPTPVPKVEKGGTLSNAKALDIANRIKSELYKQNPSFLLLSSYFVPISNDQDIVAVFKFFGDIEKPNFFGFLEKQNMTVALNNAVSYLSGKGKLDNKVYLDLIRSKYYSFAKDLTF